MSDESYSRRAADRQASGRGGAAAGSSRPSARARATATGRTRQRVTVSEYDTQTKVQTPAEGRYRRTYDDAGGRYEGARSQESRRSAYSGSGRSSAQERSGRAGASGREAARGSAAKRGRSADAQDDARSRGRSSYSGDTGRTRASRQSRGSDSGGERPSQFRTVPREQQRVPLDSSRRATYQPYQNMVGGEQRSLPMRILFAIGAFLAAVGRLIVSFFEWLQGLVPPLQRVPAGLLAGAAGVLVVALVAVGVAVGGNNTASEVIEPQLAEEAASESAESATNANAVNPNEPEELRWRDASFAIDPSFTAWRTKDNGRKVMYLTIDDGPSELTEQYLDLFDKYNVKATFFVTGHDPNYYHVIQDAYNRGHTIGLHSMTHEYSQVYSSEEAFFKDLDEVGKVVEDQIGFVPCFIRFPGGSSNAVSEDYSPGLMPKLVKDVVARGYQYYDWNLDTGDGAGYDTAQILANATEASPGTWEFDASVDMNLMLLCHDSATKQSTLEALPTIIEFYQSRGYSFEAIDRDTWVCHHATLAAQESSANGSEDEDAQDEDSEEEYDESEEESYDEAPEGEVQA